MTPESKLARPSPDRTAELLFWYARKPSRYQTEGRRRDAPRLDPEVILRLALGRPVKFADATWNVPSKVDALQQASKAYVRHMFFRPDPTPYQVLGLDPGAPPEAIKETFRLLMQLVHPDRQGEKRRWPDACAAQANWAYSTLRDQATRRTFEAEAEARAALARAISRAAVAAEASQMPMVVWPKQSGKGERAFAEQVMPEWLTAGVGGYVRHHPAATAFGVLITVAALIIGASLWEGGDGLLIRVARDAPAPPTSTVATPVSASDGSVAPTVRSSDPAPSGVVNPADDGPIVLASTAPGIAMGRPSADSATARSPGAPNGRGSAPSRSPVSTASATESAPVPRTAPPVGSGSTTTQVVAKVETAPAPEPPAFSVAIGAPPVAVSVVAPVPPANAEVEVLFANFVDAYERGRLDAFAALFDEDADTNMRRGRAAIRGEYDELFRLSQWRRMQLTRITWRPVGDRTVAKGEITVKVGWRDGREVEQRVNVDMELVRRDGRVVIARLSHQPKNP